MTLEDLGYNSSLEAARVASHFTEFEVGRVIAEHKERYVVKTLLGELEAEITGNMRFNAKSREDFPAVGDWVVITTYGNDFAVIHHILPRFSIIRRQAVGQFGEVQVIAANIDYSLVIQAIDRDFNINRLERYLTICYSSKVSPIIVLTKTDLVDEQKVLEISEQIKLRLGDVPVIALSNVTQNGYDSIKRIIKKGKTYCLLGSSGVGKSSLVNNLCGRSLMKTDTISQSTHKGRHTTSHRELAILDHGGILIDNPGMREVGIADTTEGLETTFDGITRLADHCRYADCTHTHETGCAVRQAVESGEIDKSAYDNYLKMHREKARFESSIVEKRRKERQFGKIMKNYKKDIGKSKY